jgi:hypothetical protein
MSCPQNDAKCDLAVKGLGVPDARTGSPITLKANSDASAILVTWRYNYPPFVACALTSFVHIWGIDT